MSEYSHIAGQLSADKISAMPSTTIEEFKLAHGSIEAMLIAGEALTGDVPKLVEHLSRVSDDVIKHFVAKDAFYPALATQCTAAGDAAGAHLTHIFESNMLVQSTAVRRFFQSVATAPSASLVASFQTVAAVIRQRFSTEERAIFPLYVRSSKGKGAS